MRKTKIEWCDYTWNPVTGCLHGCEYCYAKKIAKRFCYDGETRDAPSELQRIWIKDSKDSGVGNYVLRYPVDTVEGRKVPYPFGFAPTFHRYRLGEPKKLKKPQNIFVCSMADLFGDWVPDEWIKEVFRACEEAPQHRYLFLTKNPDRYIKLAEKDLLPRKHWYGYTVTKDSDLWEFHHADDCPCINLFISAEPLSENINWRFSTHCPADWVIVGAETGKRKEKIKPKKEWIENLAETCDYAGIPLFMKDSLAPIMGEENIRREFPWR